MDPVNGGNQSDPGLIGTGRGHNILIVDDIAENIEVLGTILALDGYKIGIARKGMEALMRARTGMYDLILLDIIMPEMDGFEVCRRLKSDSFTREIPIIFLSARIDKVSIVRGLEAGGQDYVTKPFNAHELLARIKTHIELREKTMALEVLNKSLEARVEERTAELIRAHKKLSLLEKAKSDFLAIISHEIRTPLNAVVNLIQLLQEMAVSDRNLGHCI
jgi:two-component system sensor histidine kinase/response regulator